MPTCGDLTLEQKSFQWRQLEFIAHKFLDLW